MKQVTFNLKSGCTLDNVRCGAEKGTNGCSMKFEELDQSFELFVMCTAHLSRRVAPVVPWIRNRPQCWSVQ